MNASQFRIKKLYTTAMILGLFLVVILLSQFFDNSKFAQAAVGVPRLLNYQGKVANSAGTAVTDGNYNFRFRLYTVSSGGTAVWTERWTSTSTAVTLNHGIFSVNLGNIATLANVDFSQDTYYLQVDFDSDSNGSWDESFSPRKQITSAVYAFNANIVTGTATTTEATSTKAYIANVLKVATTTEAAGQKLIVGGDSYFGGNIYVTGNATTSILRVNSFNLNGDDITDITGSGLSIIDGALTATGFAPTGFSGAWQTLTGNILTPTSTGAGILINAASSTITQLNVNSVTSTSRLVVGSITPTTNDPLWVGGSAYVSSNLGIGTTPTVGLDLAADKSIRLTGGTSFPIAPAEGQIFFRTDTYQLYVYANGKWQADRSTATKIVAANNSVNKEKADYVVPDGSTSAQNTINTALAALPIGGGIVYLSEGTYVVDGSVNINASSTTLMGTGAGTVIKLKDNFNSAIKIIKATGLLSKVLIRDLKVDGNKANQTSGSMTGIVLGDESYSSSLSDELGSDVRDSMVTNCWVENIIDGQYNAGILSKGGRANIITNNVSRNNGVGIFLYYPGPYNLVSNNMVENNNAVGIYFGSTYFGTLNTISGNNVVGNGGTGISVFDADTLTISDNTVADNHGSGIELVEATVYTMVSNNIIEGNYQHGIKFGGGSSNTASGNFIYGNSRESANTYDGIFVTFGSGNCMIQNNTIRRSINVTESLKYQRYGITIDSVDDNSGCLIANNNLTNSGISGDINNLADTIISNNITAKDYLTVSKANSTSTALTVTQSGAGYAALISGGNVGIGLSTPTSTLSVKNSLAVWGGANDVFAVNYLGNATTTGYFVVGAANPNSNLASGTLWSTYTTTTQATSTVGYVADHLKVATTTDNGYKLAVGGAAYFAGDTYIQGNATTTGSLKVNEVTIGSLTGLLKASSGVVTTATAGTDYSPVGFNGTWQALTGNILTPTSTGAGILVNAASSTITNLTTNNATSTRLVIGNTNPTTSDSLWVGGNTYLSGNATTTGALRVATLNINGDDVTDITGSGLTLSGGALTVTGFAPTGYAGLWETYATNVIRPTSTSAGILINAASSTITQLTVNNATTTGYQVIGTTNPNSNLASGTLWSTYTTTTQATSTVGYVADHLKVATTTDNGYKLAVGGAAYFAGDTYTQGNATTTGALRVATLNVNGDDVTDITGSGLTLSGGALTVTGFAPTGYAGAWQALTGNILTPTSTGAGILVNAASSTITQLMVNNATTTSSLNVGSNFTVKTDSGFTGVGTMAPTSIFEAIASASSNPVKISAAANADGLWLWADANSSYIQSNVNNLVLQTARAGDDIIFNGNSIEAMRVDATTNYLGIGLSNPTSTLSVGGSLAVWGGTSNVFTVSTAGNATTTGRLVVGATNPTTNDTLYVTGNAYISGLATTTGNTTLQSSVYIKDGKLGVGSQAPVGRLDLTNAAAVYGIDNPYISEMYGTTNIFRQYMDASWNTILKSYIGSGNGNIILDSAGNVGVKLTSATSTLSVNGSLAVWGGASNVFTASNSGATTTGSLKTNEATIGTLTGLLKASTGVVGTATAGVDYGLPGTAGMWETFATNVIRPTSTTAGILINAASSTITNLVTNNATSTRLVVGTTNPTTNDALYVGGNSYISGNATTTASASANRFTAGTNAADNILYNGLLTNTAYSSAYGVNTQVTNSAGACSGTASACSTWNSNGTTCATQTGCSFTAFNCDGASAQTCATWNGEQAGCTAVGCNYDGSSEYCRSGDAAQYDGAGGDCVSAGYSWDDGNLICFGGNRPSCSEITDSYGCSITNCSYTPASCSGTHAACSTYTYAQCSAQQSCAWTGQGSTYGINVSAVGQTSGTAYGIYASASGATTNWAGYFNGNTNITADLLVDTDTLKVDSANNRVGIGTASPSAQLEISSGSSYSRFDNSSLSMSGSNSVTPYLKANGTGAAYLLMLQKSSSTVFGVDSNGNTTSTASIKTARLAVGTANPSDSSILNVVGTGAGTAASISGGSQTANTDTRGLYVTKDINYNGFGGINIGINSYMTLSNSDNHPIDSYYDTFSANIFSQTYSSGVGKTHASNKNYSSIFYSNTDSTTAWTNLMGYDSLVFDYGVGKRPTNTNFYGYRSGGTYMEGNKGWFASTTNMYHFYVKNPTLGGGTIQNQYGLYVENLTMASSTNYAIYVAGGNSYFGGDATTTGNLTVSGRIALGGASMNSTSTLNVQGATMLNGNATTTGHVVMNGMDQAIAAAGALTAVCIDANGQLKKGTTTTGSCVTAAHISERINVASSTSPVLDGSVVVSDPNQDETVALTTKQYDHSVVGVVVSEDNAGFVIGGIGNSYLTLAGRIGVLVTGKNGAIHRGDLITTSDIPGYGMLATAKNSGIYATALQDFKPTTPEATGKILAYININPSLETADTVGSLQVSTTTPEIEALSQTPIVVRQDYDFYGTITVYGEANFVAAVTFKKHVYFNEDTAGSLSLKEQATSSEVLFKEPYAVIPHVVVTPQQELPNRSYWVSDKTVSGFRVNLSPTMATTTVFDWIALAVQSDAQALPPVEITVEVISPGDVSGGSGNSTSTDESIISSTSTPPVQGGDTTTPATTSTDQVIVEPVNPPVTDPVLPVIVEDTSGSPPVVDIDNTASPTVQVDPGTVPVTP